MFYYWRTVAVNIISSKHELHDSFSDVEVNSVMTSCSFVRGISLGTSGLFPDLKHLAGVLVATNGLFSFHFKPKPVVENPEPKLMKHELIYIPKTLDKATKEEVDLMKHLIAKTSMRTAFVADETAILNGFQKLNTPL